MKQRNPESKHIFKYSHINETMFVLTGWAHWPSYSTQIVMNYNNTFLIL